MESLDLLHKNINLTREGAQDEKMKYHYEPSNGNINLYINIAHPNCY